MLKFKKVLGLLLAVVLVPFAGCTDEYIPEKITYQDNQYVRVTGFAIDQETEVLKEITCSADFNKQKLKMMLYQDQTDRFICHTEWDAWYVREDIINNLSVDQESAQNVYIWSYGYDEEYCLSTQEKEAFFNSFSYFNNENNLEYEFYDVFDEHMDLDNYIGITVLFNDFPLQSRWHIAWGILQDEGIIIGNNKNNLLGICDGCAFIEENIWVENFRSKRNEQQK